MMEMAQAGELEALKADVQVALAQIEVNKAEAQSGSLFIGGWRPAVGWVCVVGLTYTFFAQPMLAWGSAADGIPTPPDPDLSALITLLAGMPGLGCFRPYRKPKCVAKESGTDAGVTHPRTPLSAAAPPTGRDPTHAP